jgi:hypothetical protein
MTETKTLTLDKLKAAGYKIDVRHLREFDVASTRTGKVKVETRLFPVWEARCLPMASLRACGGMTEVWVTDPETSAEFYGYGKCHPDDNYNKRHGITEALKKIESLMLVMDGKDGFKYRLQ